MAIMSFADDLAVAKSQEPEKSDPISVVVGTSVYELTFTQAPGEKWAESTSKHPPRLDQPIDRNYGYNFHGVVRDIAPMTCTVTKNGEPVELVVEKRSPENPNPRNDWRDLFDVLDGSAFARVADAVWALNQWGPDQRTVELGKASRVVSEASSDSLES